jgi:hypothetical protein
VKNGSEEFVVLEHTTTEEVHWDLMLEDAGALLTWRLTCPPEEFGSGPVQAQRIFDHPLRFLTYEGAVQQNTGTVKRVDKGSCRWMEKHEPFIVNLSGTFLQGQYQLHRQGPDWVIVRQ